MINVHPPPNQRRFFLTTILGGLGAVLAVAAGWPVFRFLAPGGGAAKTATVEFPRDALKVGEAHFFTYRERPAVILRQGADEFVALSAVCTHLGCIVQWLPDRGELLCPCHGGRFATDGSVLGGPPSRPLEAIPVVSAGNLLRIG